MTALTLAERLDWVRLDQRTQPTEADYRVAEQTAARLANMSDDELADTWGISTGLLEQVRQVFATPWR